MLRLLFSLLLLLLSLLAVFRAPTNFLWRSSVAVTEFPFIFMLACLLVLLSFYWPGSYRIPSALITSAAFVLFALPVITAYQRASGLQEELEKEFKTTDLNNPLQSPFSFFKMFSGVGIKPVDYKIIQYKKLDSGKELAFDYYPSSSGNKSPVVIVIHGGSWAEGDSKQLPALNSYLANRGYNVAAINYRLAPAFQNPAPVEDTRSVIDFITTHHAELNADTSSFVLLGRSAGGQIALLAAYTFNDPKIKGVVSFYAPADMVWGAQVKTNKWVLDVDKVLGDYIGGSYRMVPDKYKASSPFECMTPQSTPTLLIHGKNDAMVSYLHTEHMREKLKANALKHFILDLPLATHGCDYNISGPSGQLSTYVIERFINSVTSRK
ncbi:MAG: esterase/lipase [Bacteroidetes bacterium]|jgi:acetyl esterase/lipase|nr:esterase/lipase [Bacteroidota bacterium]